MNDKITPLPWKYDPLLPNCVWTSSDVWIASTNVETIENFKERAANAAYIVTACNAYPKLVEALRKADTLILKLATVAYKKEVENHLPYGLLDEVKQFLAHDTAENEQLIKAAGVEL